MGKHDWLDKYIKKQKHNRKIMGKNAAELQDMAEKGNWDSPKKKKK